MNTIKYSLQIARVSTPCGVGKEAVGTGFIIKNTSNTDDITFLTNAHVVAPGQKHYVEMAWCKPEKIPAHVVAICYDRDLSLLKVSRELWEKAADDYVSDEEENELIKKAPPLELGDKTMLSPIGTSVYCQGHPLGLPDQQVSWGKSRGIYDMPNNGEQRYLIQAPINHGNSGGPVFVEKDGKRFVIGVSTMKLSGKQVEGEGGIITVMEMKAIIPTMMSCVKPTKFNMDEKSKIIMAMLAKALGNGHAITSAKIIKNENQSAWVENNWEHFNEKWNNMALGGRVGGVPRSFKAWCQRHIVDRNDYLYNGEKTLGMVVNLAMNNEYEKIEEMKTEGWRNIRLKAEKHAIRLDLSKLVQTDSLPTLLHAPILGWENLQSTHDIDYKDYYGIDNNKIKGVVVNTVLPNSLYELGGGHDGDLIYAFSVHKVKGKDSESVYDKVFLDKEGKFSIDGTALGTRLSLTSALHHLEWKNDTYKHKVMCFAKQKDGQDKVVNFIIRPPTKHELPLMQRVLPFNNESKNLYACKLNGLTLAQCNENHIQQLKLTDYFDLSSRYKFRIICLASEKQRIIPGSTMTKLNGESTENLKSWKDFCNVCQIFQEKLKSDNPPKYWTAEFSRPGFKCKVINKV